MTFNGRAEALWYAPLANIRPHHTIKVAQWSPEWYEANNRAFCEAMLANPTERPGPTPDAITELPSRRLTVPAKKKPVLGLKPGMPAKMIRHLKPWVHLDITRAQFYECPLEWRRELAAAIVRDAYETKGGINGKEIDCH